MSEKMVRTQVYLPKEIYDKLKSRAQKDGLTMANQIREALSEYVVEKEEQKGAILKEDDPIWVLIGIGEGGPADGSANHDKYLYLQEQDSENK